MPLEGDLYFCMCCSISQRLCFAECGNMLIMVLSYTQKSNDSSLITQYVRVHRVLLYPCAHYFLQADLLNQWTQYLVAEALIPANQISTDDFAGALANQTNLAIKGVVGIQAMSVISGMLGDTANQQNYSVRGCRSSPPT